VSAVALLLELRAQGIAVDAAGDRVRCRHRPGALPADLADRVRAHRAAVLALLADPDALRAAAAEAVFDAAPEACPAAGTVGESIHRPPRCRACGHEGAAGPACPVCHPPAPSTTAPGHDHPQPDPHGRPTVGVPLPDPGARVPLPEPGS